MTGVGSDAGFVGDIPTQYDRGLGPVIFEGYAADLARRVAAHAPSRVLEIAAGTGILTRHLRALLPGTAQLTATDLNPPMLSVAQAKFRPAGERIEFRPADATALPFPDGAFDAIACQFGAMFFPDKPQSYREARRVLAPGGRYLFSVWDSHRYNAFGRITHEIVTRLFPSDPPAFYRTPFGYHEIDPIKEALIEAGFAPLGITVVPSRASVADLPGFVQGLVYGNPVVDQIRARGGEPDRVVAELKEAIGAEIRAGQGMLSLQAIVFEACVSPEPIGSGPALATLPR